MSRLAVCLLFIAVFHHGINNSSTQETTDETKSVSTKETIKEDEVTSSESTIYNNVTPDESKKGKKITNESSEEKHFKAKESKKVKQASAKLDDDKDTVTTDSNTKKSTANPPLLNSGFEFTGKVLAPVMKVRTKIGDAVSRGVDGAKDIADGAYNFFRDAVTSFLK